MVRRARFFFGGALVLLAMILATLFLNFWFWLAIGWDFPFAGPPLLYFSLLVGVAVLLVALFYIGPAFSVPSGRSLFDAADHSFGAVSGIGFRICCVAYLVLHIAGLLSLMVYWCVGWTEPFGVNHWPPGLTAVKAVALSCGIIAFLAVTSMQSIRVQAKLSLFTVKLGLALLIAAMFRERSGLWRAEFLVNSNGESHTVWHAVSIVLFWAAPLAFLGAHFGRKSESRRDTGLIGLAGLALPFAVVLFLLGWLGAPGGGARIDMSFLGHGRYSYVRPKLMIFAISMFGVIRFGIVIIVEAASVLERHLIAQRIVVFGVLASIALLAVREAADVSAWFEPWTRCPIAAAGAMSADFLVSRWRSQPIRRFDLVGVAAFFAGWGIPLYVYELSDALFILTGRHLVEPFSGESAWWHPWVLPCYGVSFLACALGRFAERIARDPNPFLETGRTIQ